MSQQKQQQTCMTPLRRIIHDGGPNKHMTIHNGGEQHRIFPCKGVVGVDQEHELLSFQVEIAHEHATIEVASRPPQPLANVIAIADPPYPMMSTHSQHVMMMAQLKKIIAMIKWTTLPKLTYTQ